MTAVASKAQEWVYAAIDMLNAEMPEAQRIEKAAGTALLGSGSYLDSLQLINLLVFLDDRVLSEAKVDLRLSEDARLLEEMGPLRSVGALAVFLENALATS